MYRMHSCVRRIHHVNSIKNFFSTSVCLRSAGKGVPYKEAIKDGDKITPTSLPESADVVVIGGGSLGCSTLYNLSKMGVTNTVLLETHQLTAGTTWHTAGLVWRLRPNDTEIQLLSKTRDMLLNLEEETGINPGWINNGGIFIASNKIRLDEYKRLMTAGKAFGIESYILDKNETKKIYPLMNVDDVYGTLYVPGDGTLEPAGFCSSLARYATNKGAKVLENCPVTGISVSSSLQGTKKIKEVQTALGSIKTTCVVNATGCWGNDIANMVGSKIPLIPMKHAYVVTERIEGIENMPNVRDHDASVYLRLQGDALSVGGYECNPIFLDKVDKNSAFGLFDLDWEVFEFVINGSINRIPVLGNTGIKSTVCGPESFTPDHKPIMGEDPEVLGFYHCCGFNSAGMMLGGGCGHQMADWIVNGRPFLDMFGYDIRRFNASLNSNSEWIKTRSHESYAKNYATVYPHDEPLAGRGMLLSPLHQTLENSGCIYQERHGWERPGWFYDKPAPVSAYDYYGAYGVSPQTDTRYKDRLKSDYTFEFPEHHETIRKECLQCRTNAAIYDMSYFGKFIITGPDAESAIDWLCTANMQRPIGRTVYTCMTNERGGAEADLTVSIVDGDMDLPFGPKFQGKGYFLGVGGAAALQNWAHIVKEIVIKKYNVNLTKHSEEMAMMSLQGPASRKIMESVSDGDFTHEEFPFSTHKIITIARHRVLAIRLTFVGELGFEIHLPKEAALPVYKTLMAEGKKYGIINSGYRALESLSTEKGFLHWHADLRPDDTPLEAGIGFTCRLKSDTDFLGKSALLKQKAEGLKKKLVTFTLDDSSVPVWGLEAIWRGNSVVGYSRVSDYAFALDRSVVHGYVSNSDGSVITEDFLKHDDWRIESMGKEYKATLHLKAPFDPKNLRIKGFYDQINSDLVF